VTARNDASGLTQGSDWQPLCRHAAALDAITNDGLPASVLLFDGEAVMRFVA